MSDRSGTCAECGEVRPADGESAGPFGGRFICVDCFDVRVAFVAECLDCEWDYRSEGRTTSRHDVKQLVQNEANSHETEKRVFEGDSNHETVWREAEPDPETADPVIGGDRGAVGDE